MINKTIEFFETAIDDGFPFTLPIALIWVLWGWPFYLLRPFEGRLLRQLDQLERQEQRR